MKATDSRVAGSFRDPDGQVHLLDGVVYRTVSAARERDVRDLLSGQFYRDLVRDAWLVQSQIVDWPEGLDRGGWSLAVRHDRLDLISHPYEWPFGALKDAALFHIDLQLRALAAGYVLSDASAYNIQFVGAKPMFIDMLSLRPYHEGEYWGGHRQYVEQFLNPLLLRSMLNVPHNAWYRGNLEGISSTELVRILPLRVKARWGVFANVVLPALKQRSSSSLDTATLKGVRSRSLSKNGYRALLEQMRSLVDSLKCPDTQTTWQCYEREHTYDLEERKSKREFVAKFVSDRRPGTVIDFGCNSGEYSQHCLEHGAGRIVGFDFDHGALDQAFSRAKELNLAFTPLFLDAANPSPSQGWNQCERESIDRIRADAVIALAFEHHLTIGRNIPLDRFVSWIMRFAPEGVIEFVPKEDPTIQRMLAIRDDVFPNYNQSAFEQAIRKSASIVAQHRISSHGRVLYHYKRVG